MTDELERLQKVLHEATPAPEADAKARALAAAEKIFAEAQGSAGGARPSQEGRNGPAGFLTGVRTMIERMGFRPSLAAASGLAVIGLAVIAAMPQLRTMGIVPSDDAVIGDTLATAPAAGGADTTGADTIGADKSGTDGATADESARMPAPVAIRPEIALDAAPPRAEFRALARDAAPPPPAMAPAPGAGAVQTFAKIAPSPEPALVLPEQLNTERFANGDDNPLRVTAENPVSTFSIDVDTASWSFVRASLMTGQLPPADAVRVEEMINYFPYAYPAPTGDDPFSTSIAVFETPWNTGTELVRIGIQGEMPAIADRPPLDLVFLIDTSGSMQQPNKLPLLKQSFRLLLAKLAPDDKVAIVTYAGSSGLVLEPTAASDRAAIMAALDRLQAGGSTAGHAGLVQAYDVARTMHADGRIGRVILATDGDFNVGIADTDDLKDFIAKERESGVYLSVLGFGRGNTNDALMQALAQNGNGTAAYIDTLSEAQKVLADQVAGALYPIANDVKIQVEFNPATVAEYRLIGYETRQLAREDFANDRVDAGDIGAGHTVTALYEVTPVGSPAILNAPLRYGEDAATTGGSTDELGFVKLRYKVPGETTSRLITAPIPVEIASAPDEDARFAAAIAGFGQLLRGGKYLGAWGYGDAIDLANGARGDDPFGYRTEAVTMMRLAETLAAK